MPTDVELCNRALDHAMQRETIASLADSSASARACNRHYTAVRDQLLRAAPWGFCKATEKLTVFKSQAGTPENPTAVTAWANTLPPPQWLYAYTYPADCVAFRYITDEGIILSTTQLYSVPSHPVAFNRMRTYPFEIGTMPDPDAANAPKTVIYSSVRNAVGFYNRKITDEDLWDADFIAAFEFALASRLAAPRAGSANLSQLLADQANNLIMHARVTNANENPDVIDHVPDWLQVRGVFSNDPSYLFAAPWGPLF